MQNVTFSREVTESVGRKTYYRFKLCFALPDRLYSIVCRTDSFKAREEWLEALRAAGSYQDQHPRFHPAAAEGREVTWTTVYARKMNDIR